MTSLRSYGDPCGIARALDVVGERWALLVVRELLFGPRRFSDLRIALGASPNVLTQRLGELEDNGIVQRRKAGGALYELTDRGHELHPILVQLCRWGADTAHHPAGARTVDALMVELEARFAPTTELQLTCELRLGEERFAVEIDRGAIRITRSSPREPDLVLETTPEVLWSLVTGERKLTGAPVELRGETALARSFVGAFARR